MDEPRLGKTESIMSSTLRVTHSKTKGRHIDGAQFQFGLEEVNLNPERFAELICSGRRRSAVSDLHF